MPRFTVPLTTPLPLESRPKWPGVVASLGVHALLVIAVLTASRAQPAEPSRPVQQVTPIDLPQPVTMVYLPPAEAPKPLPDPVVQPPRPDAVHGDTYQEESRRPTPEEGLPSAKQAEGADDRTSRQLEEGEAGLSAPAPDPAIADANRRFIPIPNAGGMSRLGMGPESRYWKPESPEQVTCYPKPRDATAPIELVDLVGRVFTPDNRPLSGAFLQIIGTRYSTFSDQAGRYKLTFDASLVDQCRTQFVRVVAAGYRGRNLILGIGPGDNDVVLPRY